METVSGWGIVGVDLAGGLPFAVQCTAGAEQLLLAWEMSCRSGTQLNAKQRSTMLATKMIKLFWVFFWVFLYAHLTRFDALS